MSEQPTARRPWTVTLCWTPDQNFGRVAVMPNRHPVSAVWDLLIAGDDPGTVAEEHAVTPTEVRVLDQLRREINDGPTRAEVIAELSGICSVAELVDEMASRGWLSLAEEPADG